MVETGPYSKASMNVEVAETPSPESATPEDGHVGVADGDQGISQPGSPLSSRSQMSGALSASSTLQGADTHLHAEVGRNPSADSPTSPIATNGIRRP